MANNRKLSQLITRRLRELEAIIDDKQCCLSSYSCGVCEIIGRDCAQCPLNQCDNCLSNARRWFLYCESPDKQRLGDNPNKKRIAKEHYKFILKLLKKNGWEYV